MEYDTVSLDERFMMCSRNTVPSQSLDCLTLKMKTLFVLEMSGTSHHRVQHHIAEYLSPQTFTC